MKPRSVLASSGVSLLELVMVLAVTAILASLASAGYASVRVRAARHEVRMALWRLAATQETHRLQFGRYAEQLSTTGVASAEALLPPPLPPTAWQFRLTAFGDEGWEITATSNYRSADLECVELRLDHTGLSSARDSAGNDSSNTCWRR